MVEGENAMARRKLPKVLTDQELAALLRQPNVQTPTGLRNKAMLKMMAYGGLRVSEVVNLRTQHLRRDDGRIYLDVRDRKAKDDTTVPLSDYAAETLDAWLARRRDLGIGNGAVFCTISSGRQVHPDTREDGKYAKGEVAETELTPGDPLTRSYIGQMVKRLGRKAGIEKTISPHVLRHTAATRMLKRTGDIRRVQEFLGHSDVSTTQIYTEILAADVAEAVDAVPDVEAQAADAKQEKPAVREQIMELKAQLAALEAQLED